MDFNRISSNRLSKVGKTIDIKLGYSCNDNCIHCVVSKLRDEANRNKHLNLNKSEYFKIIDNYIDKFGVDNISRIILTGGEPTIRNDFEDIVNYIKKISFNSIKIHLQSNGRRISNNFFFDKIKNNIDSYEIALHGPNDQIHDKITRTNGSFNETIKGIKNIVEFNNEIIIGKIVLSQFNYKYLKKILHLYKNLGVKKVIIAFPHSNGNENYMLDIAPRYKNIKLIVEESLKEFGFNKNFIITFENLLPCALDGEYNLIHFIDLFENFKNTNLKMLDLNSSEWKDTLKKIKKKDFKCNKCIYNKFCNGYWKEYIEEFGFDEFNPKETIVDIKNLDFKKYLRN